MKCLPLFSIVLLFVPHLNTGDGMFNFRKDTLTKFNDIRRWFASGDIAVLAKMLSVIPEIKEVLGENMLGPAANMYKLQWNHELEKLGYEYMNNPPEKMELTKLVRTLEYKDHLGFFWVGDIFSILEKILDFLPAFKLKDILSAYLELLETVIILLWMIIAAPKSKPIPKNQHFGQAEALFATRHEIGCFSNVLYSVCFVKKVPYEEWMFEGGVACFNCPYGCELSEDNEGYVVEGDLCLAPKSDKMGNADGGDVLLSGAENSIWTVLLVIALILLINK